ncbi:MAG: hypothetical protein M9962_00800 [Oligoflexia bacterium]|nr:hypothetical protein [Oligoflexia bacterium]
MKLLIVIIGTVGLLFQTNFVYASLGSSGNSSVQLSMVDVSGLQNANVTCAGSDYQPTPGGLPSAPCQACKQKLDELKQKIPELVKQAKGQDGITTGATTAGTQVVAGATTGQQQNTQTSAANSNSLGSSGAQNRANIANKLAQELKQCASDIQSSCNGKVGPSSDGTQVQNAMNSCNNASQVAQAAGAEQQKNSGGLGEALQAASGLAQALGPLAQMLAGKQDQSATDPYQTQPNYQTSGGSTLNDPGTTNGTSFTTGQSNGTELGTNPSVSSEFASVSPKEFNTGLEGAGGFDSSSGNGFGSGGASGADIAANGGGGALGSSGSFNSSGASKMGDKAAEAAAAANSPGSEDYAYGAGGGGGGGVKPAMLGLKSKSGDLEGLADLGASNETLSADENGERMLASEEQGDGIHGNDGSSLFNVIHSKYSEIKRRGSI